MPSVVEGPVLTTEQVILDPVEVSDATRTEFDLTPWIAQEGIDWQDSAVESHMAKGRRGSVVVDYDVPNRVPTGVLKFARAIGAFEPLEALALLEAKVARIQEEGGWLKRELADGRVVFADVVSASLKATSWAGFDSQRGRDLSATITLECLPDWYGEEVDLGEEPGA